MAEARTDGYAVASLVCGLVGFLFCGIPAILAIVFGTVSLGRIKQDPGLDGSGMAVAGRILGIVWVALFLLLMIAFAIGVVGVPAAFAAAMGGPPPAGL